jgi:hypothetical protein
VHALLREAPFELVYPSFYNDKDFVVGAARLRRVFEYDVVLKQYNDDFDVMLASVIVFGSDAFGASSDRLKSDFLFQTQAIKSNPNLLRCIPWSDLQLQHENYKELTLMALSGGLFLDDIDQRVFDDKTFAARAVLLNPRYHTQTAYKKLFSTINDDKDVMIASIKLNHTSFVYASERLRDDEEVLLHTQTDLPAMHRFASQRLRTKINACIGRVQVQAWVRNCIMKPGWVSEYDDPSHVLLDQVRACLMG